MTYYAIIYNVVTLELIRFHDGGILIISKASLLLHSLMDQSMKTYPRQVIML